MSATDATEAADIDYLLEKLGHGAGTLSERSIVKTFRTQLIIAGMMDAIRVHQLGSPPRKKGARR